jgi:predicted small integral membrane protein
MIDNAVNEQIIALQQRLRNDPAFEQNARREWAKLCRSIPLQGASALQNLFIELKPTRAVAAQPRIDASNLTLTLGVEAETRVTSTQTQPNCPFPATLTIVPPGPGKLSIGVPVDMPFTELNKIIEAQLVGKTFPEDNSGAVAVTVKKATVSASGDRLLISLLVNAKEKQSWFGLGGEATVHVWGKPALDQAAQTLRFTDLELAVESEAAFGLLGAAARAAMPLLQKTLAERATIDLKPFASNAQKKIAAVIADFQKNENGIRVGAEISSLRLGGIAFDSKTLRVIAEADGAINVNVTALPGL